MTSQMTYQREGYHSATPYLICDGAAKAITFYKEAFGATEVMCIQDGDDKVRHAVIQIGDSKIQLSDEYPVEFPGHVGPLACGSSTGRIYLYLEDVDSVYDRAVTAGATGNRPPSDQPYGDRVGILTDPFGHVWYVGTCIAGPTS